MVPFLLDVVGELVHLEQLCELPALEAVARLVVTLVVHLLVVVGCRVPCWLLEHRDPCWLLEHTAFRTIANKLCMQIHIDLMSELKSMWCMLTSECECIDTMMYA